MNPFLADILAQPRAIAAVARRVRSEPDLVAAGERLARRSRDGVLLVGMGSSLFAAYAASVYLQDAGIPAVARDASELLLFGVPAIPPHTCLMLISQSGESLEIRRLLPALRGQHEVIGLTNHPHSLLGREADVVIPIGVQPDHSIAVKTYTGTLALLVALFAGTRPDGATVADRIDQAAAAMTQFVEHSTAAVEAALAFLGDAACLTLAGHGPSFASAWEGSLLFKEGAKLEAEATTGGQFRHGAIEVVEPGHTSIVFAPRGRTLDWSRKLIRELLAAGGRVLAITSAHIEPAPGLHVLAVPATDEFLTPLLEIVPVQLLTHGLALRRGVEPGTFRNTTPVVSV